MVFNYQKNQTHHDPDRVAAQPRLAHQSVSACVSHTRRRQQRCVSHTCHRLYPFRPEKLWNNIGKAQSRQIWLISARNLAWSHISSLLFAQQRASDRSVLHPPSLCSSQSAFGDGSIAPPARHTAPVAAESCCIDQTDLLRRAIPFFHARGRLVWSFCAPDHSNLVRPCLSRAKADLIPLFLSFFGFFLLLTPLVQIRKFAFHY